MYGLFQTSFYFGYMAVFSTALGIMCGKFQIYGQLFHSFSECHVSDFMSDFGSGVYMSARCGLKSLPSSQRILRVLCLYSAPT